MKANETTQMILDDIRYSFRKIMSQNLPILSITITDTNCKTTEELKFCLTNKLFNRIHILIYESHFCIFLYIIYKIKNHFLIYTI